MDFISEAMLPSLVEGVSACGRGVFRCFCFFDYIFNGLNPNHLMTVPK